MVHIDRGYRNCEEGAGLALVRTGLKPALLWRFGFIVLGFIVVSIIVTAPFMGN